MSDPTDIPAEPAPKKSFLSALAVYWDRRIAIMLGLGFGAGMPNFLAFDTLSAWLRKADIALSTISLFSLVTLPYSFKFLWAPWVDRTDIPVLTKLLGHRRSWMLVMQGIIILALLALSTCDPKTSLGAMAGLVLLTAFASATQDIVVDAWRIEAVDNTRQGAMAAAYQWGYRIANVIAGAAPLLMADKFGWHISYAVMAMAMIVGVLSVLGAPAEAEHRVRPIHTEGLEGSPVMEGLEWAGRFVLLLSAALFLASGLGAKADILAVVLKWLGQASFADWLKAAWIAKPNGIWLQLVSVIAGFTLIWLAASPIPGMKTRPGVYLFHALGDPLADFFRRYGKQAALILALICFYRLSDFVLNIMNAFYQDVGFSLTQIAEIRKVFGVIASMAGVFVGGLSIARLGIMRSLVIGSIALPITNTIFGWLAIQGHSMPALLISIGIDNVVSSYAGTCLIAYMSSLTSSGFTATQYALFSSLYSLPGKLIASQSGRIVESAAHAAQQGGPLAFMQGLFVHTPPDTFAQAMEKSQVAPAALGSGYVVFFLYSGAVGILSMVLAVLVAKQARDAERAKVAEA